MKIIDINGNQRECMDVSFDPSYPNYAKITYASKREPGKTRTEWYPTEVFFKANPELKSLSKSFPKPVEDVTGVVSRSKEDLLKDAKQTWKPDSYTGFNVWISRGLGEGQIRTVIKNTKNTLYVDKPWEIKPDKTSQYVVSRNIHDLQPMNNVLPEVENKKNLN